MYQHLGPSALVSYLWPSIYSISLHVLVFGVLFASFDMTPELPRVNTIMQATLYQLKSKSHATTQTNHKLAGEAHKSAARQAEVEQMEQDKAKNKALKALSKQKKEAAAQKVDEAKKIEKALESKKAKEKEIAHIAKNKSEEESRKKVQEAARESSKKQKAQALADLLSDTPHHQQSLAYEYSDEVVGSFDELIRERAAGGWARPLLARKGMTVVLQIGMLPDGTVTSVIVSKSSGDDSFDSSAVAAVSNIVRLTEMQEMKPSDFAPYRSFKMTFTPEDLSL